MVSARRPAPGARYMRARIRPHTDHSHISAPDIIGALLAHHYTIIPFTIDPFGQLGPIMTDFLFGGPRTPIGEPTGRPPGISLPIRTEHRSSINLTSPQARTMRDRALASSRTCNLLSQADNGFTESQGKLAWYTDSYTATRPTHWAKQYIGHNIILALTHHLSKSISWTHPLAPPSPTTLLHCAGLRPRSTRPSLALSSAYNTFFEFGLTFGGDGMAIGRAPIVSMCTLEFQI